MTRWRAAAVPVLLAGHSYGGIVLTHAGAGPGTPVSHLVYVAAFPTDMGETVMAAAGELSPDGLESSLLMGALRFSEDGDWITVAPELAVDVFYHDCEPQIAAGAMAWLRPQPTSSLFSPTTQVAWRELPSTYVLCADDRAVPADLQERLAERAGSKVVRLDTSHSPFLSAPGATVKALVEAAGRP